MSASSTALQVRFRGKHILYTGNIKNIQTKRGNFRSFFFYYFYIYLFINLRNVFINLFTYTNVNFELKLMKLKLNILSSVNRMRKWTFFLNHWLSWQRIWNSCAQPIRLSKCPGRSQSDRRERGFKLERCCLKLHHFTSRHSVDATALLPCAHTTTFFAMAFRVTRVSISTFIHCLTCFYWLEYISDKVIEILSNASPSVSTACYWATSLLCTNIRKAAEVNSIIAILPDAVPTVDV